MKHASDEEGNLILCNQQNFMINQGALYLCSMPKGKTEDLLLFMVPKAHHVATLNGCHQDVGHQGARSDLVPVVGTFLVAGNGWPSAEIFEVLYILLVT